jgi:hypothetical protein
MDIGEFHRRKGKGRPRKPGEPPSGEEAGEQYTAGDNTEDPHGRPEWQDT